MAKSHLMSTTTTQHRPQHHARRGQSHSLTHSITHPQSISNPHPNPRVALLQKEIARLEAQLPPGVDADAVVQRHIKLLHSYNEIKDGAQALIGKASGVDSTTCLSHTQYAVLTHTTVTAVHRELGLSLVE